MVQLVPIKTTLLLSLIALDRKLALKNVGTILEISEMQRAVGGSFSNDKGCMGILERKIIRTCEGTSWKTYLTSKLCPVNTAPKEKRWRAPPGPRVRAQSVNFHLHKARYSHQCALDEEDLVGTRIILVSWAQRRKQCKDCTLPVPDNVTIIPQQYRSILLSAKRDASSRTSTGNASYCTYR